MKEKVKNKKIREKKEVTPQSKRQRKRLLALAIAAACSGILIVVLVLLKRSSAVSEFMVTKVSRNIILIMGKVASAVPFSMFELLIYLAIFGGIACITAMIVFLIKKKYIKSLTVLTSIVLAAAVFGNIYFVSAGFSYNRYEDYFPVLDPNLTKQQTVMVADYFIDDFNRLAESVSRDEEGNVKMPYSAAELSYKLQLEYMRLNDYNINAYTPKAKTIVSSTIMSEMHIRGVFFAPFGEANINAQTPYIEMPFVMAHEMAHAKGIMREDDADNTALYITITSSDPFIRYSAYSEYIYTFLSAVRKWEELENNEYAEYTRLTAKISPLIRQDWKKASVHWSSHYKLSSLINKLNDFYLKLMGQEEGTGAYIPPPTGVTETPIEDPNGNPITDPDGDPIVIISPSYNTVQQIFFRAYVDANGKLPQDEATESDNESKNQ